MDVVAASIFFLLHLDFPGQDPLVVLIVAGQQGGRIQPVGALGLALVAVQAALDLLHFGLTGRAQMLCRGRAPEQQAHAGAVVDLDAKFIKFTPKFTPCSPYYFFKLLYAISPAV